MNTRSAPGPSAGVNFDEEMDSGVATMEDFVEFQRPK